VKPFVLGRQPALDGVRAVAIAAVIAFHFGVPRARAGYLGVDVFFVLSGFLITALLIQEHTTSGGISLRAFYIRRARRLLPALYILLVAVIAWAIVRPNLIENETVTRDVLGAFFYVTNFVNSIAGIQPVRMLSHAWSLAIEEQFYLLWPALVIFMLWRRWSRWAIVAVAVGGIIVSGAVRMVLLETSGVSPRLNQGLDTRGAGSLLVGCALGMLVAWRMIPAGVVRRAGAFATGGLLVLVLAVMGGRYRNGADPIVFREAFPLIALSTAAVILGVYYAPRHLVARVLALPALVWIGRVSYGLYLWHVPIRHIFRPGGISLGITGAPLKLAWLAITLVVVTASFYIVEQPILARRPKPQGKGVEQPQT
jgi:peptidoglycan/LPS O-acetylase OafA/YrhL